MFLPSNITLKLGDSGDFVAELQRRLARTGCFDENQINGFFDNSTAQGVIGFQSREGLHADGVAGPETLRRLNGVIAGDSSASSSDKKEEEQRAVAQAAITQDIMLTPAADPGFTLFTETAPAHSPYGEEAYRPATPEPPPVAAAAPPQPAVPEAQRQAELAAQPPPPQPQPLFQPPPVPAAELLNPPPQPAVAAAPPPPAAAPHPTELAAAPAAAAPAAPAMGAFVSAAPPPPPPQPVAEEPQQQPGLVGKVARFANSMVQKLSDYFEAKLPPSVLREVQAIGVTMAASGMKEAPIPGGPELPSRGPELPTRGPEQGQLRG